MNAKKINVNPHVFISFIFIYTIIHFSFLFWFPHGMFKQIGLGIGSILAPLIASILIYQEWRRENQKEKIFWGLLFFGTIFYLIGQSLWLGHYYIFEIPPYPSYIDIFFLLHPFLFLCGLIYFVSRHENKPGMMVVLIDIFITIIVISIICWYFFIEPIYLKNPAPRLEIIVSISYPLLELLVLFGLFHTRFLLDSKTLSSSTLNSLTIATLLYVVTDSIFLFFTASDSYAFESIIEPLSALTFLLFGLSALFSKEVHDHRSFSWIKKYMNQNILHTLSIIILSLLFIPHILSTNVLLFMFLVGILLILFRQFLMLKQNKELNRLLDQTARQLEEKNEELKKTVKKLESLNRLREMEAKTDYLTGTYNRRFMEQLMHAFIKDANCHAIPFSVLLIDVDRFKSVNDQFGHDFGDKILFEIASLLQQTVRKSDVVGRLGGEEFIILLPSTEMNAALKIAERTRQLIEQSIFQFGEIQIKITISIGVTSWKMGDSFDKLYKRVDEALYEAKNIRNKVVYRSK
ncbi:GGDEF domain-containing protein [Fervidibacillus halotolerans]|uniref:GGDEF domain-containing protein n=1 Tax=Fervidibacillus halotolerans TaxID=2980027 RepID=A0A9E8M0H3_9BACI|nr:GGDEF domain-containing protein [Fervidibacillus halotolerans]WAA12742.1 GGDEF domain-containing protein [Fervidibacillus halotolerans]